jgi:hypothetical protein
VHHFDLGGGRSAGRQGKESRGSKQIPNVESH